MAVPQALAPALAPATALAPGAVQAVPLALAPVAAQAVPLAVVPGAAQAVVPGAAQAVPLAVVPGAALPIIPAQGTAALPNQGLLTVRFFLQFKLPLLHYQSVTVSELNRTYLRTSQAWATSGPPSTSMWPATYV